MNMKESIKSPFRRMVVRNVALVAIMGLFTLYAVLRDPRRMHEETFMFSTMSTMATVKLAHKEKMPISNAQTAAHEAVREVEKTCNIFDPESELARLNASAADEPFACSDLLWDVLCRARTFHRDSGGVFDVTIDPLMKLWGFHREFTVPGMSINLGGIAKGYALDRAAAAVLACGVKTGWIEIGGNILALPKIPGGGKYDAGVRNPFDKDAILVHTSIGDAAISTSGNYERYVVIDGKRYTHIIDPATGLPVADMDSVTVIVPAGLDVPPGVASDAISTSIFIAGPDAVAAWTEKFPGLRVLIVRGPAEKPEILKFGKGWGG